MADKTSIASTVWWIAGGIVLTLGGAILLLVYSENPVIGWIVLAVGILVLISGAVATRAAGKRLPRQELM